MTPSRGIRRKRRPPLAEDRSMQVCEEESSDLRNALLPFLARRGESGREKTNLQGEERDSLADIGDDDVRGNELSCAVVADGRGRQGNGGGNIDDEEDMRIEFGIPNWLQLMALMFSTGTGAVTKDQYTIIRAFVHVISAFPSMEWRGRSPTISAEGTNPLSGPVLPSYETIRVSTRAKVKEVLAVDFKDVPVRVDMGKTGARNTGRNDLGQTTTTTRIVLPSEYARMDEQTPEVWAAFETKVTETAYRGFAHATHCTILVRSYT